MERLWAPWRMEYIIGPKEASCIFCGDQTGDERHRLIVHRTELSLLMLNRYPYTNGHLLVAPRRHTPGLDELTNDEMLDLFTALRQGVTALTDSMRPDGFNVGINLGRAAGAGVTEHLHLHIVPRWQGDTNFMAVVDDVRVVPEHLLETYDRLRPLFAME